MFRSSLNVFLVSNFIQCNFLSSRMQIHIWERLDTSLFLTLSRARDILRKSEIRAWSNGLSKRKREICDSREGAISKRDLRPGDGFQNSKSTPACLPRTPPLVTFLIWPDLHLLTARNPNCLTFISMKTFFHPRDRTTISLSHTLRDEHRLDLPFKPCLACMAWGEILEDFQRWFLALLTHWDGPHKRCWISCLHSLERSSQKQWLWA